MVKNSNLEEQNNLDELIREMKIVKNHIEKQKYVVLVINQAILDENDPISDVLIADSMVI